MTDIDNITFRMLFPNNAVIEDECGKPSVMVYVPKFTMAQVIEGGSRRVHPAFVVNNKERDGFWISKYQNTEIEGAGYSLPAETPYNNAGIESSLSLSSAKGAGWHLTTLAEWGAVALWCKKNGYLPRGNNDFGKDKNEPITRAVCIPGSSPDDGRVLTGSGPVTWSHDGTSAGIWDMKGNLSEWIGGFRTVFGELQVLPDNDGADTRNSQAADSTAWRVINAATGKYAIPNGKGTTPGSVKCDYVDEFFDGRWVFTDELKDIKMTVRRCTDMSRISCDGSISPEARELLIAFALISDEPTAVHQQYAYMTNGGPECFMYRGGYWGSGASAGIFCWSCSAGRDHTFEGLGFRSAYMPDL
jgi:hypothetical protein